jgi:hypothetical protein
MHGELAVSQGFDSAAANAGPLNCSTIVSMVRQRLATRGVRMGRGVVTTRILGVILLALLTSAAAADAEIVLDKSIHGVQLGMTKKQVQRHLGAGKPNFAGSNNFHYHGQKYIVTFTAGKASAVLTTDPRQRTSQGFGFGTKFSKLKKQRGFRCVNTPGYNGETYCSTSKHHVYTVFEFALGGSTVIEVNLQRTAY